MKKNIIIKFRDEDHTYWRGKENLTSVNKLLGNFGFDFDRDYWIVHKGIESVVDNFYKKFFSRGFDFEDRMPSPEKLIDAFTPELNKGGHCIGELTAKISDEWELSSINGTNFHNEREDEAYELGYIINPYTGKKFKTKKKPKVPKGYDNVTSLNFLKDLEDGVYAELILFSLPHMIAGQSDETFIETINGVRYVDIGDHKTNKKLPKNNSKNGTCLYPLEHLNDSTYTKYQCQVSMYAHLLEILGFTVRNVGFYHYKNYDPLTKNVIKVDYLGKECEDILYTHKENLDDQD